MLPRIFGYAFLSLFAFLVNAAVAQDAPQTSSVSEYRDYALNHGGNARAGQTQFESSKTQCSNCHCVTGMEKSGPNLDGIGDKYSRSELIEHILRPSLTIKPGYEQAVVETTDGKTIHGRLERSTKLAVRLIDVQGKQVNLKRTEIEQVRYSPTSLMPDNVVSLMSPEAFASLITYLESLEFGVKEGLAAGGQAVSIPRLSPPIKFVPIHPPDIKFDNPVWCGVIPGHPGELAVAEHQQAKVWRYVRGREPRKELFVDLASDTFISANQGLMCVAFHPGYESNGRYFLEHEVKEDDKVKTTIVERRATSDGLRDSGRPSKRLIEVEQPAFNHNGGCIDFGRDGMLYAAFGDGGPQRDPNGYSQNAREFLGSFIRIDVDKRENGRPYSIPADNPFLKAGDLAVRPETWAIGFREPWRFSFDALTGDLWVGDVGQEKFEEVCLVKRGENHGWNVREGFAPYSTEYQRDDQHYADPLFAYEHGLGFSVTGGYVYRADRTSSFYGVYIFGDYNTRRVWGLRQSNGKLLDVRELGTAPGGIASFGVDDQGEILLVTYAGQILHLDLSETEYR